MDPEFRIALGRDDGFLARRMCHSSRTEVSRIQIELALAFDAGHFPVRETIR